MSKATIGVAIIAGRDTKDSLLRLLAQLKDLDQVVVVNTSGQGAITTAVKKLGKPFEVHEIAWRPSSEGYGLNDWGFSYARNESFRHLTTDYGVWVDTDDVFTTMVEGKGEVQLNASAVSHALRKIVAEAPDVDVFFWDYHYSYDETGNPNVVHARERMVKEPTTWKWVYPIHEALTPSRQPKHSIIRDIKICHLPTSKPEDSAERNMRMLQDWLKQLESLGGHQHDLQRCRLLIGDTLWGQERYREAADWLENVFLAQHPEAIDIEKWQASTFACKSYISIGNLAGARRMALQAIDLEPSLMDGYLLLAEIKMLNEEDPQDILNLIETGGRMEDPPPQVIKNPLDYTFTPFCITSECKYRQGEYEIALTFALKALNIRPNDERAEKLRLQAAAKLREQDGAQAIKAVYQLLRDYDEHEKAAQLFNILPYSLQSNPDIYQVAEGARKRAELVLDPQAYVDHYSAPANWEPVPWNFFEENKIPGRDRYEYILARLRTRRDIKKVLWVGSDDGFHSILLAKQGYDVTGVDLNKEGVRIGNERAEKLGVSAKFVEGWIEKIQLEETGWLEEFDAVVASEQIEKVMDVAFWLETLGDCVRPGGIVLLTTPSGAWDGGDIPYTRGNQRATIVRAFTQETLESLLRSNQDYHLTECHFLPYRSAYREKQGWQVAELVKGGRPAGPVIRIWCGERTEEFNPLSLSTGGIGGSETAVIHMAHYWAQLGCQVVVYANSVGVYDGVLYRFAEEWSPEFRSDVFIAWRLPHLFGKGRPNAGCTVLWNHDLDYPIDIKPEWCDNIDVITVLSEFHKEAILERHPQFPREKVWVTRNGIEPGRFMQKVEKQPHHYFYTSSHVRGLEELLAVWPEVRKQIPDATLHVGYGTQTAANFLKDVKDYSGLDEIRGIEQRMYESEGIVYHGRLNQWELARLQLQCAAWLYPYQHDARWGGTGGFLETYCITALEAQAARAMPITRLNGALPEVVNQCIEWTEDWTTEDLIAALESLDNPAQTKANNKILKSNYDWAMSQTWSSLAREWLEHLIKKEEPNEANQQLTAGHS